MDGVNRDLLSWRSKVREVHHKERVELDPAVAEALAVLAEKVNQNTGHIISLMQQMADAEARINEVAAMLVNHSHPSEIKNENGVLRIVPITGAA